MVKFLEQIKKEPKSFRVEILASCIGCLQDECDTNLRSYAKDFLDADYDDKCVILEKMMFFSSLNMILDDFEIYSDVLFKSQTSYSLNKVRDYIEREEKHRDKEAKKEAEELPFK